MLPAREPTCGRLASNMAAAPSHHSALAHYESLSKYCSNSRKEYKKEKRQAWHSNCGDLHGGRGNTGFIVEHSEAAHMRGVRR